MTSSPPRSPKNLGHRNSLSIDASRRSGNSPNRVERSPTLEEQKSINMAESLNARARDADGKNFDEVNWYELRPHGA